MLRQLFATELQVIEVVGDGNCFFRCLSVGLDGHQENHASLHKLVTYNIAEQADTTHPDDRAALLLRSQEVTTIRFWPGDVMPAVADALQRPIHIYVDHFTSPIQYVRCWLG